MPLKVGDKIRVYAGKFKIWIYAMQPIEHYLYVTATITKVKHPCPTKPHIH